MLARLSRLSPSAGRFARCVDFTPKGSMKLPKAAWWVLVPLSWLWQYLIYLPAYLIAKGLLVGVFGYPYLPRSTRWSEPKYRPWLRERLR